MQPKQSENISLSNQSSHSDSSGIKRLLITPLLGTLLRSISNPISKRRKKKEEHCMHQKSPINLDGSQNAEPSTPPRPAGSDINFAKHPPPGMTTGKKRGHKSQRLRCRGGGEGRRRTLSGVKRLKGSSLWAIEFLFPALRFRANLSGTGALLAVLSPPLPDM